ncbi:MAG TPA: hypothetical protein VJX16_15375 [Terriglobales bacterium]|nr:hypothetical protein [Terriglobales bacterium]
MRLPKSSFPQGAMVIPAGIFFSVVSPAAPEANRLIYLAYAGALVLAAALLVLGLELLGTTD